MCVRFLAAIKATSGVKALAHITGGGFTENVPRVLPAGLAARIDASALNVPPVFSWMSAVGNISESEMLKTFNCGTGMVVVVDEGSADDAAKALADAGEQVTVLGSIVERSGDAVVFDGALALERG